MEFICEESALKIKDYIIISDLHIGFEEALEEKGYTIPDQTSNIIERLSELSKIKKNLIILGDVKHAIILKNKTRLLKFLSQTSELFNKIIIIKGNHDGGIENFTNKYKNIQVESELLINSTLLVHGHKYASEEAIKKAKKILIGHFHSAHKIINYLGEVVTKKTWIIYEFNNELYAEKNKTKTGVKKVLSFPCFNSFFDGTGEKNGPYSKYLTKKEVLTLDLTRLV